MARQVGPIYFTGTIGHLSFYKSGNDYLVRKKGGPDKKQIMKDPQFIRTRENLTEFGRCSKDGAFIRRQLGAVLPVHDKKAYQRLTQLMCRIKYFDRVSARGERRVSMGISTPEGRELLYDFAFNDQAPLQNVLQLHPIINRQKQIIISSLEPGRNIIFPRGATHAVIGAARLQMDLNTRSSSVVKYSEMKISAGDNKCPMILDPKTEGEEKGNAVYFLQIRYYTMKDELSVPFKNGTCDSLGCIAVDPELAGLRERKLVKKTLMRFSIKRGLASKDKNVIKEAIVVLDAPG